MKQNPFIEKILNSKIGKFIVEGEVTRIPILGNIVMSGGRTLIGVLMGLVVGAILIAISGVNPIEAYGYLLKGAFGNAQSFSNVLVRCSPLLLGGVGVAIGNKAGVWNTGVEGYMYLGALGAAVVAIPEFGLPPFLHIVLVFLSGMFFAGLWGLIPAYLRAYKGVNEVTCTIMLNYVAIYFTNWMVSAPQPLAEVGAFYPMSKLFQDSALLPAMMKGSSLHIGPFIGIVICLLFFFILNYTSFGFKTRMLGANIHASQYSGVNVRKQVVFAMLIGALLGGLSGAIEICGLKRRVYMGFVTGLGYESVAVALLAQGNPLAVIISALFFAVLKAGGVTMSIETGVSASMTDIIIAFCVLFVIGVGMKDAVKAKKGVYKTSHAIEEEG